MGGQSIRVLLASSSLGSNPTHLIRIIDSSQMYFDEMMFLYTTQQYV